MKPLRALLVDLNSVLHPIWHVSSKEPDPDYAAQTTVSRIHSLAHDYDMVAICCDSPKSARKELDPTYKSNRPERDERLIHQIKLAQEQLGASFPVWQVDGWEADDVIASAVTEAAKGERVPIDVTICSSDKDLLQLLGEHVSVYTPNGKVFGVKECAEKFVAPHQMRDYLILVGDSSDNVRGVPGIGPVKAKALLAECGSIVGIYERIRAGKVLSQPFTPSIVTAMQESLMLVEATRKLIELKRDLPIPFDEILQPRKGEPMETEREPEPDQPDKGEKRPQSEPPPPATELVIPKAVEPVQSVQLATVEWARELEPRSLQHAERLAKHMFDSRLFSAYGTPQAVLSTILAGRELGVGAMASLRGFHIIEGRPSMSAGLMAALILQSGKAKYFRCVKSTSEVATFKTHRIGDDEPAEVSFTIADAQRAGLVKDKSGWAKYPADMLVARATARLARLVYPDICFGLYTPEELNREDLENYGAAA